MTKPALKLPDTGVTGCYDNKGVDIPTPAQGQPFYGQNGCFQVNPMVFRKLDGAGRPLPDAATWETGYRMVEDLNTGLTWEVKSPTPGDVNAADDTYSWEDAQKGYITRMNKARYGGFSDWRMPNKDELRSILNYGLTNPAVDPWYFPNCKVEFYWTKNTYEMQPYFGWVLFFGLGSATACGKSARQFVRAVRGGLDSRFGEPDLARFVDNGDGTVTDATTGLMWQQGENDRMNWFEALQACQKLRVGGHDDWRLPNIKELNTILNLAYQDRWWYFKTVFPAKGLQPPLLHYFSSTPFEKYYAWVTNFCFGYDGYYASKEAKLLFRAVRNTTPVAAAGKSAFRLPDTGQRASFDDEGNTIPAPRTGEKFHGQDASFVIHPMSHARLRTGGVETDDGATWSTGLRMVLDRNTGLVWEVKSPAATDLNHRDRLYTYEEAQSYVQSMNAACHGGFSDWRLPNREELRSIVDYGSYSPALAAAFDRDCPPQFFWSRDAYGANPDLIWGIYFAYGCAICYPRRNRYAVRLVRAGYNPAFGDPAARAFRDNGDGTVTDLNSGLMWQKDEGPELVWADAMQHCAGLRLGGHADWRLPNIKEIGTLVDPSFRGGCWFDKDFFPNVKTKPLGFYWASSTYASTFAWGVNFQFGYDGYYAGKKEGKYPFRPVRNA